MSGENWRKKYARHPKVIAALERTHARVKAQRRVAIAAAVVASTSTLDAVVQQHAREARQAAEQQAQVTPLPPPPPGYVRSANGGPELWPAMSGPEQRAFVAELGKPRK